MPATDPDSDAGFMRRAIRLAMNGRGRVEPNPMVGCVVVRDGRVIGEGYHEQFGGPHAEPNALAACTESPQGATAYVTLEPCCHTNKKTPPCVPRLIEAKIGRVVVGCLDPNAAVNGGGLAQLRDADIAVGGPVLEPAAKQLIAPFIAEQGRRPWVTLKWAESLDAKVAGRGGARLQISGDAAQRLTHELRSRCDAILVGINTVLTDDPILTARGVERVRPLLRVVLDRQLRIPRDSRLMATADELALVVGTTTRAARDHADAYANLKAHPGVVVFEWDTLSRALHDLSYIVGVTHLLVEPGPTLARGFFAEDLVDRVWVFRGRKAVDEPTAPAAAPVPTHYIQTGTLDLAGDTLTEYLNPASPVFFAAEPSADFVLARELAGQ